jgi:hypothetical protein
MSATPDPASGSARRRVQLLYVGDATLARECLGRPGGSIEVVDAAPGNDGTFTDFPVHAGTGRPTFDAILIEHGHAGVDAPTILASLSARSIRVPAIVVAEWDEALAARALSLGASDYVIKSRGSLRAVYFRLHRLIAHGAQLETGSTTEQLDRSSGNHLDRQELVRRLTDAEAAREVCEWRLNDVLAALKQARHDRLNDALAAAREQLERDAEFANRIRTAEQASRALHEQLTQRDAALRHAEAVSRQAAEAALAAGRRIGELEVALREELEKRRAIERELAALRQALEDAERRRLTDLAAFDDKLAQERARTTVEVARIARARDEFELRMHEGVAAASRAQEERAADLAAADERHARREAELVTELRHVSVAKERLERRLTDADEALRCAEQRVMAAHQAGQQRANERQAEYNAELSRQRATQDALRQQLSESKQAFEESEHRHATDMAAAQSRFISQREQYDAALRETAEAADSVRARLIAVEAAFAAANEQHGHEMAEAAARFGEAQERASTHLSQIAAEAVQLESRLTESEHERQRAHAQHLLELAEAAARLADSQHQADAQLADASARAARLEEQLAESERERQRARAQHAAELTDAASRLAESQRQADAQLGDAVARAAGFEAQLAESERDRQRASEQHAAELTEAAARLAESQRQADAQLGDAVARAAGFEAQLAESERDRQRASEQHAAELTDAAARLAASQQEADDRLAQTRASNAALENRLIDAAVLRQQTEQRHSAELADAAVRLASYRGQSEAWLADAAAVANRLQEQLSDATTELDRVTAEAGRERDAAIERESHQKTEFERHLADEIRRGDALAAQLWETEAALQSANELHTSEMAAARTRLAAVQETADARLAQAATAIKVAESKRAETSAALNRVVQQAAAERQAASIEVAERQAHFKAELAQQVARRHAIEQEFTAARAGFELAERRLIDELAATVQASRDRESEIQERANQERAMWDRQRLDLEARIGQLDEQLSRTRESFAAAETELERLSSAQVADRAEFERLLATAADDVAHLRADRDRLQLTLDQTRAASDATITRMSKDHAAERASLDLIVAEREAQLRDLAERKRASDETAAAKLSDVDRRLLEMRELRDRGLEAIAQLRTQLEAARETIETTTRQRDAHKAAADRVPIIQQQIDSVRATRQREFEDTPVNRFRCRRDGTVMQVNRALADRLGFGSVDELQRVDFGSTVFEAGDELDWLVEQCLASGAGESIDTTWRKRDGTRMVVRLMAVATDSETVDFVVEDVTRLRTLEAKLRHAQRMESVARYGSEVAVTCHAILKHVKDEGEQWLSAMEGGATRYHGELLLDEVTRAARLLGQLAVYGDEQTNAPELVELNAVLRDLEPVLKRVAGDNIDVVLPKTSTPLTLDVEVRPVERMLVNVAAFGRERMPLGGRLLIDVDSVVVDREFVAKHPHVRPGAHVLLTVNEVRRPDRHDPAALHIRSNAANQNVWVTGNPGVELTALQALVSDCGGHLWMKAEPPGDMVLKIHLPRRVLDRAEPAAPVARSRGPQWIRRAFGPRH